VCGHAHEAIADNAARSVDGQIVLSDVHAAGPGKGRNVGAVVHDEGGAGLAAALGHWCGDVCERAERELFGAKLHQRDSAFEPGLQQVGGRNLPRGGGIEIEDGVEPRKLVRLRRDCPAFGQADSASEPFFSLGSGM
jgi:hypothetical protein